MSLVRGAEWSCRADALPGEDPAGAISLHLLAYLFDPEAPELATELRRIKDDRLRRGRRMVDLLVADGYDVSWDEVVADAAGGTVGRPHLARALVRHGYVADMDAAFGPEWLASGSRYWAEKYETEAAAAIGMVRAAGGVAVIAHPRASTRGRVVSDAALAVLARAGMAGLEVAHKDHTAEDRRHLSGLAADLGLLVTGSSDFHGSDKSIGLGAHVTDPAAYAALVAPATGCPVITG